MGEMKWGDRQAIDRLMPHSNTDEIPGYSHHIRAALDRAPTGCLVFLYRGDPVKNQRDLRRGSTDRVSVDVRPLIGRVSHKNMVYRVLPAVFEGHRREISGGPTGQKDDVFIGGVSTQKYSTSSVAFSCIYWRTDRHPPGPNRFISTRSVPGQTP